MWFIHVANMYVSYLDLWTYLFLWVLRRFSITALELSILATLIISLGIAWGVECEGTGYITLLP